MTVTDKPIDEHEDPSQEFDPPPSKKLKKQPLSAVKGKGGATVDEQSRGADRGNGKRGALPALLCAGCGASDNAPESSLLLFDDPEEDEKDALDKEEVR
jgi:hypothetical protein|eukprot:scaffold3786_cov204-Alexandrium_tamarense.AAC.13